MGIDHLIDRRPRCRPCPQCKSLMLAGIDEGIPFRVDPYPLNQIGELFALCQGLKSFEWRVSGHVSRRTASRMKGDGKYGVPIVVAVHRHHYQPPPEHIAGQHYTKLMGLMNMANRRTVKDDKGEDETQDNALWMVHETMGGLVIEDLPPF